MDVESLHSDALTRLVYNIDRNSRWLSSSVVKKNPSYANPDYVLERYDGLMEKFLILGRNDLATELQAKVNYTAGMILIDEHETLISIISDMEQLSVLPQAVPWPRIEEQQMPKQLTWDEIIMDDPLEGEHWQNITDSSYYDDTESSISSLYEEELTAGQSYHDHNSKRPISQDLPMLTPEASPPREKINFFKSNKLDLNSTSTNIVETSSLASYWKNQSICQKDIIREAYMALRGFPSILFTESVEDMFNLVRPNYSFISSLSLMYMSNSELKSVLESIAKQATVIARLRQFSQYFYLMDKFPNFDYRNIFGILDHLNKKIDVTIIEMENKLLNDRSCKLTLLSTTLSIDMLVNPYELISTVLQQVLLENSEGCISHVLLLNTLYNTIANCSSQGASFGILVDIFREVLLDYFVPLQFWLSNGALKEGTYKSSFMIEEEHDSSMDVVHRYKLRSMQQIPLFLQLFAYEIFNIGDSIMLTRMLNISIQSEIPSFKWPDNSSIGLIDNLDLKLRIYFSDVRNWSREFVNEVIEQMKLNQNLKLHLNIYFMLEGLALQDFLNRIFELDKNNLLNNHNIGYNLRECWLNITGNEAPFNLLLDNENNHSATVHIPRDRVFCNFVTSEVVEMLQHIWNVLFSCCRAHFNLKQKGLAASSFQCRLYIDKIMLCFHLLLTSEAKMILDGLNKQNSIHGIRELITLHIRNAHSKCCADPTFYSVWLKFFESCQNNDPYVNEKYDNLVGKLTDSCGSNYSEILLKTWT